MSKRTDSAGGGTNSAHELSGAAFIDQFAEVFSGSMPPIAGRMLGALMFSEKDELSSRELADQLHVSMPSVSNMGRLLIKMGLVDRTVSPQTRRDMFSIHPDIWQISIRTGLKAAQGLVDLADRALDSEATSESAVSTRIRDMRDFYAFFASEIPALVDRYEQQRHRSLTEAV